MEIPSAQDVRRGGILRLRFRSSILQFLDCVYFQAHSNDFPRIFLPALGHPCALQPCELAPSRFSGIQILAFEARFEFPIYGRASAGAASILSHQHCGNRLLSSTGGAEVTGGGFFLCIAVHAEPSKDGHPPGHSRVKALPPAPQGWATHKYCHFWF